MISSLTNPKVKFVRRLQVDKRFRAREAAFVVEGTRWLTELMTRPELVEMICCTSAWQQNEENAVLLAAVDGPVQLVSDEVMAAMSDTETPPGVLAVLRRQPRPLPSNPSLLLILDAVANPGNLGTLLRTAGAAGAAGILLGPGCVDVYNPKVVRGGMGAHLRLPLHHAGWQEIGALVAGLAVWVAAADGETVYTAVNWCQPSALIIGSEAHGTQRQAESVATGKVRIPMHAATESLNAAVAASVILFEAARQRGNWPSPTS